MVRHRTLIYTSIVVFIVWVQVLVKVRGQSANQRHSRTACSFTILLGSFRKLRDDRKKTLSHWLLPSQVRFFIITSQPAVSKPQAPQNQHTEALSCLPLSANWCHSQMLFCIMVGESKGTFLLYLHCIHVWQKQVKRAHTPGPHLVLDTWSRWLRYQDSTKANPKDIQQYGQLRKLQRAGGNQCFFNLGLSFFLRCSRLHATLQQLMF